MAEKNNMTTSKQAILAIIAACVIATLAYVMGLSSGRRDEAAHWRLRCQMYGDTHRESWRRILADDTEDNTPACPFPKGRFPEDTPLAMAYVPFQMWEKPYEADVGLSRGTIFPSIDKPFIGEEAVKNAHTK